MKKRFIFIPALLILTALVFFAVRWLYTPKALNLTSDAAYFWATKKFDDDKWLFREYPTGHKYFLYLPEKYRDAVWLTKDSSSKIEIST